MYFFFSRTSNLNIFKKNGKWSLVEPYEGILERHMLASYWHLFLRRCAVISVRQLQTAEQLKDAGLTSEDWFLL